MGVVVWVVAMSEYLQYLFQSYRRIKTEQLAVLRLQINPIKSQIVVGDARYYSSVIVC